MSLLEVRDLVKDFPVHRGPWRKPSGHVGALAGVSFALERGECLALVGESGSGKTTLARCLTRLIEPSSGQVLLDSVDLLSLRPAELRRVRRRIQMIFQDPHGSLNPRMTVGNMLKEPLVLYDIASPAEIGARVDELLHRVGLSADAANRLPHEFSGGQRQRIGLARALAPEPDILVADEPVSALDVSMRAEMLNLLTALRRRRGLAVVLIAHDLAMVRHAADRVAVMYSGKIVEMAPAETLFVAPQHPYTRELLASMPVADPAFERQVGVSVAEISQRSEWSSGCRFHPRCPLADERCRRHEPVLTGIAPGHLVSCHYPGEPEPRATKGENDGTF